MYIKFNSGIFFLFLAIALGSIAATAHADFNGLWSGTWSSNKTSASGRVQSTLTQSGSSLSGYLSIFDDPNCGTPILNAPLTGTVTGNTATFNAQSIDPCTGEAVRLIFTNGTLSGNTLTGSYENQYYDGGWIDWDYGVFNLDRVCCTISATAGSGGSIIPSGVVTLVPGASQTFNITPDAGYAIANVSVNNVSQGPIPSYTFNNVTDNHIISAAFLKDKTEVKALPWLSLLLGPAFVPTQVPAAPINVSVINITATSARLTWTDQAKYETYYEVGTCSGLVSVAGDGTRSCLTGLSGVGGFDVVAQAPANSTSHDLISLTASTSYSYFVRAVNDIGVSSNLGVSFDTISSSPGTQTITINPQYDNHVYINSLIPTKADTVFSIGPLPVGCNWSYIYIPFPTDMWVQEFICGQGLVRFDLSAIAGKTIESARLQLATSSAGVGIAPREWHIRALATSWSPSTVTWNIVEALQYYLYSEIVLYPPGYYGQSGFFDIDVTDIVQSWVSGNWNNYGLLFGSHDYTAPYATSFDSFEFYSLEDPGQEWPKLIITYH